MEASKKDSHQTGCRLFELFVDEELTLHRQIRLSLSGSPKLKYDIGYFETERNSAQSSG